MRSLRTVDVSLPALVDPLRLLASFPQAMTLVGGPARRPSSRRGGTWPIPVVAAAAALRVPVLLWEGNEIPGRSVRAIARLARVRAVTFPETRAPAGRRHVTGTPIRDLSSVDRQAARRHFEIPADARPCSSSGGRSRCNGSTRPWRRRCASSSAGAVVVHVTGKSAYAAALARREALPAPLRERYRPFAFLHEEMAAALAAADLVVGRAGSSTIAEVTAVGMPLVLVPYPHAAGHQAANARAVAQAGAALVIADEAFDGTALLDAVGILADPRRHLEMSSASRSLARPGAAVAVATLVLALADRQPVPSDDEVEAISRGVAA